METAERCQACAVKISTRRIGSQPLVLLGVAVDNGAGCLVPRIVDKVSAIGKTVNSSGRIVYPEDSSVRGSGWICTQAPPLRHDTQYTADFRDCYWICKQGRKSISSNEKRVVPECGTTRLLSDPGQGSVDKIDHGCKFGVINKGIAIFLDRENRIVARALLLADRVCRGP